MMSAVNKILIVEDEAIIAMTLRAELLRAGYNVCGVLSSGEEAIAFVKQELPDLILMDIHLAGDLDGLETARLINDSCKTFIIFMSGYDNIEIHQFDHAMFIGKPVHFFNLKQLIESI